MSSSREVSYVSEFEKKSSCAEGANLCIRFIMKYFITLSTFFLVFSMLPIQLRADNKALGLYKQAVDFARQEKWEEALELFGQATELGAPPVVHYNIARCLEALGRFEEAAQSYAKYLDDPSAAEVEKIKSKIKKLREKPSKLSINSDPVEATVIKKNDDGDEVLGKTPIEIKLKAGKHVIILRKDGYKGKILKINAGYGKTIHIKTSLEPHEKVKGEETSTGGAGSTGKGKGKHVSAHRGGIGLVIEAGGGFSLHPYRNVDVSAGGSFNLDIHKILGHGFVHFAAGVRLNGNFYSMESVEGNKYRAMFIDALAFAHVRLSLAKRIVIIVALPLGASFLVPVEDTPSSEEMKLIGGRIIGESIPFFSVGLNAAMRVNIISGFHILLRPAELLLLVPLRKIYSNNKVLPRYSATLLLGWEF